MAAGAGLLFLLSSKSTKKNNTIINQQQQQPADYTNLVDQIEDNQFEENNGVTSPTGSDVIPFIVPSSFVIEPISDKFYYLDANDRNFGDRHYVTVAKISFLLAIYVPPTSLGGLSIEEVFIDDIQAVQYIDDLTQKFWNVCNQIQRLEIAQKMVGKEVNSGFNLFEIEFYYYPDINDQASIDFPNYDFEALSMGFKIKYEETRLNSWRCLSAWNIKEDNVINEGSALGTNTRFGVIRNKDSKPREQRGLFSEWWADYVQSGYNTNIVKIETIPTYNFYLKPKTI